jgi:alkyl hydroperoxide reductase subunit AhpC
VQRLRYRLVILASAGAIAAAVGCGVTVPACTEELTAGIVQVSEPSAADRAVVTIDPGKAQEAALRERGGGRNIRVCLGVSEAGHFTDERRVVYAVRFELGQGTEVMLVDASTGETIGGGAIVP